MLKSQFVAYAFPVFAGMTTFATFTSVSSILISNSRYLK